MGADAGEVSLAPSSSQWKNDAKTRVDVIAQRSGQVATCNFLLAMDWPECYRVGAMAGPLRRDMPDDPYHVPCRGLERWRAVRDHADRERGVDLIDRVITRARWSIYVWDLVANHLLLFLRCPHADLSAPMHDLNVGYATRRASSPESVGGLGTGCQIVKYRRTGSRGKRRRWRRSKPRCVRPAVLGWRRFGRRAVTATTPAKPGSTYVGN